MVYDAETIQQAMARAGRLAQLDVADTLAAFDKLGLTPEERLAGVAGAIAACRAKRHAADGLDFIAGLRELTRPALGWLGDGAGGELFLTRVVEGVRLLAGGLDRIVERLTESAISGNGARLI